MSKCIIIIILHTTSQKDQDPSESHQTESEKGGTYITSNRIVEL